MERELGYPVSRFAISSNFTNKAETTFTMHCHDRRFKKVSILSETGATLFTASSDGFGSWSWRRTIKDAEGNHLFDIRKIDYMTRDAWGVKSLEGEEICSLRHPSFTSYFTNVFAIDVLDSKSEVVAKMRPQDQKGLMTTVQMDGVDVVEIQLIGMNDDTKVLDRTTWKAKVASGVDLVLVVAIMLVRAELQHVWRK